jgi:lysophospholipase L1-like esterase
VVRDSLLSSTRPDLALSFENLAISGATTTQSLTTLPGLRRQRPDWLFCLLGTNDVERFGSATGPRLVSQTETMGNDTAPAFSGPDAHLEDGLHPTLQTQQALAAEVLTWLAHSMVS